MNCRSNCGACCIAPSITSPLPGMPEGKPADVTCVQLLPDYNCALFNNVQRPSFCSGLQPSIEMCGDSRDYALLWLQNLELSTKPSL